MPNQEEHIYDSTSRVSLLQSTSIHNSSNDCKELINFFKMQFQLFKKELPPVRHYAAALLLLGACRHIFLSDFMLFSSPSLQYTTRPQPQAQWGNVPMMWFLKFVCFSLLGKGLFISMLWANPVPSKWQLCEYIWVLNSAFCVQLVSQWLFLTQSSFWQINSNSTK